MKYKTILFDLDGTLLDTNELIISLKPEGVLLACNPEYMLEDMRDLLTIIAD